MSILLIEDHTLTAEALRIALRADGHDTERCALGEEGAARGLAVEYSAIILDLMLPDMSGLDVLRTLRAHNVSTPVLVLSGDAGMTSCIDALRLGADDYLTKPFYKSELTARLRAIVRRSRVQPHACLTVGCLSIDLETRTAFVSGTKLRLTPREYQVLELLVARRDHLLTRETIFEHLYNGINEPCLKVIDIFICKLRKKLAAASNGERYISTVWGSGYRLHEPESQAKH